MAESLEIALGKVLRERGWTIAVAETTTGGLISARIVAVPGSSAYFERGVVAYSKASKCEMLGIDEQALNTYGAVSAEAARAMATGIRKVSGANLAWPKPASQARFAVDPQNPSAQRTSPLPARRV